ncbi:MAG: NAD(+)/NADH kinase [Sulfolobales archaeon]
MGFDVVKGTGHEVYAEVVRCVTTRVWSTTAFDTRRCASQIASMGVKLLVFVSGDRTVHDILDNVDRRIPVPAVPAGVKVYSSVFAINPRVAARIVERFLEGLAPLVKREVLDVDKDEFRRGRLRKSSTATY